jgi:hypothetical protein
MSKIVWITHGGERTKGKRVEVNTLDDIIRLMRPGEDEITIYTFSEYLNEHLRKIGQKPVDYEVILT